MSWSSQARGYFLPDAITKEIEDKITKAETYRAPGENSSGPITVSYTHLTLPTNREV